MANGIHQNKDKVQENTNMQSEYNQLICIL